MSRPSLITIVQRAGRGGLFGRGDLELCACSGGPDSTALLHALAIARRKIGHRLVAVGVDHGLRTEARAELAIAADVALAQRVPFEMATVAVEPGANLQARAREARHRALQAQAQLLGAKVIALGHTADDRAETVVMRLLRGAGPRGLAVMPARSAGIAFDPVDGFVPVDLVRPLIAARRSDVAAHLERHRLASASDPSNTDRRFLRARVRSEVMPLLEALSPQVVAHLCALADQIDPGPDDPLAGLPRAQRAALGRALAARRSGTLIRLGGGYDLALRFLRHDEGGEPPR